RYSSELRANRLPAGQIAVLSRTVLARILRLDRRTGISAKADLTAPPQTCRKDTIKRGVPDIALSTRNTSPSESTTGRFVLRCTRVSPSNHPGSVSSTRL
ncbi:MAG: hypothetical protein ACREYE_20725, partial [Gammaproteobacteria bacterium]